MPTSFELFTATATAIVVVASAARTLLSGWSPARRGARRFCRGWCH